MITRRHHRTRASATALGVVVTLVLAAGCGGSSTAPEPDEPRATALSPATAPDDTGASSTPAGESDAPPAAATPSATADRTPPAPANVGRRPAQERVRFVPGTLLVPGQTPAQVLPVGTRDGSLEVPDDARDVGWWDGGAWAGDPFGSTVLAGHINDKQSIGTMQALIGAPEGTVITLGPGDDAEGPGATLEYRIVSSELLRKETLTDRRDLFEQRGPHRLVLITCWGEYTSGEGFDSNYVVIAEPVT